MELRAHGPLFMLDAAFGALRAGGAGLALRAVLPALPLSLCVLALDYFEQVEGVRALRLPLCFAIALGWLARGVGLSRVSRAYARLLRPGLPMASPEPRALAIAATAGVVGFGALAWGAPMLFLSTLEPLSALALWPLTALRGGVAPSWLARASCGREHGAAAFGQAFDDTAGMRGVLTVVELMVQLGAMLLLANLFALVGLLLTLAHHMFGLDVAFVSAFSSTDNAWTVLSLACLTLLAFEPLRAAVSAQAFVEARTRLDGADLLAAVDLAIESGHGRPRSPDAARVLCALLAVGVLGLPGALQAQALGTPAPEPPAASVARSDDAVRERAARILARDEFREHAGVQDATLSRWLQRLFAWLSTREPERAELRLRPLGGGPLDVWVAAAAVLLVLGLLAYLLYARAQPRALASGAADDGAPLAPGPGVSSAPAPHEGDSRAALRALYLATLAALDRAGLLELDPSRTNGQHLRALPRGPARRALAELTREFDRVWYGGHAPSASELERCRALASAALGPRGHDDEARAAVGPAS